MKIGLRIDVDSLRGTRNGVPNLCEVLNAHSIKASFFFSVGPDNMGRHIWRMVRPSFLWKMLRTRAPSLYGWDILLRGTFGQGPIIGETLGPIIRSVADAGHEVGLHAWDHHAWQAHIDQMDGDTIYQHIRKGVKSLTRILDRPITCSASPAWRCNDRVLLEKERFPFAYNSDCRGEWIFYPVVREEVLGQPQIPVTLPTYDEVIGAGGIDNSNYNDHILSLIKPDRLNVLAIHAEVEGITLSGMFEAFLIIAKSKGASFVPLEKLLRDFPAIAPGAIVPKRVKGREGWVSFQAPAKSPVHGH